MMAQVAQAYLIVGTDEFLIERGRCTVVDRVRQETGRRDIVTTIRRAGEITEGELLELLSPSLFSEDRVVVVMGTENAGKEAAELLIQAAKDPGPGMRLVICHSGAGRTKKLLARMKKIIDPSNVLDANPVSARDLPGWVMGEFRRLGHRPTPDVVQALLEGVGSDLRELATAVTQLIEDAEGRITVETVRAYYSGIAEVSAFDIADWAVTGKRTRAIAATRRALQLGISPVAIAAALSSKVGMVARLYSTRGRVDARGLAAQLGAPPFVIEKTARVARRWSGASVSRAVILLADLDATVKGQGGDPNYAIESAVATVAELAG